MILTFENIIIYIAMFLGLYTVVFYLLTFLEHKEKIKTLKPRKFPKISIIIPAYNEEKVISKTIRSALNVNYPKKEIMVVDDESTDDTYRVAKKYEKYGVKVFTKKHGGKAAALNFGISKSSSEFIMALDADSSPDKSCLKRMVGYFENPRVMAVTPTLKVWKPKNILERMQAIEYTISVFGKKTWDFMGSLSMTPGAPMIRTKFLKKCGGFDENNMTEDFDMGLKIQSRNYDIIHALDAVVYTVVPNTFKKLMRQRIRWDYGRLCNIKKYGFMLGLEYGELGIFVLPMMLVSLGLTGFLMVYWIIKMMLDLIHSIYLFSLISFDFRVKYSNFQFSNILNFFLDEKIFLITVSFFLGLSIYIISKKYLKEKFKLEYILYVFVYGLVLGVFQVISIIRFLIKRKPKW